MTTAVVATATAACGLLMLSGAGPAPASADDVTVPAAPAVVASSTEPDLNGSTTTQPAPTEPPATELVMLATIEESTTTTAPPAPIPLSVAPQSITVGVGGSARISGECPVVDGSPLGPVEIWEIGSTVTPIATGVTAAEWSYDWTAPADVEPLALQIWCGDPSQYEGGYPESLQIDVVYVDQVAPTTTTTTVADQPQHVIPETG
jgi:hypothetical protein